jgi:hypothetical protein
VDVRRLAARMAYDLIKKFSKNVFNVCLKGAETNKNRLDRIREDPELFLLNLQGFSKFLVLDELGELASSDEGLRDERLCRVRKNCKMAVFVRGALIRAISSEKLSAIERWSAFVLVSSISGLIGFELPEPPDFCSAKGKKRRLSKGWKVRE